MRYVPDAILIAYARRAAFKLEVYDNLTTLNQADSYVLTGTGVDTLNTAIGVMGRSKRNYVIIDDPDSGVIRPTLDDLNFMLAQFILLYGNVTKPGFDEPKYV
jgi:hypothetical protein